MTKSEISQLVYETSIELMEDSNVCEQYTKAKEKNPNFSQDDLIFLVSNDSRLFAASLLSKVLEKILGIDS